ncbi:MAG: transcriptional regulator NrdR, partial [Betaproteobacteria bacterium]
MKCPFCHTAATQVIDSRAAYDGATIRRRRRCLACEKRFTTYERVELAMPTIVKRGGVRADYDRNKLRASMLLALRKRPVPREAVDDAIGRIEEKLI